MKRCWNETKMNEARRRRKAALMTWAEEAGETAETIASYCGATPRTAGEWLKPNGPVPSSEMFRRVAEAKGGPDLLTRVLPDGYVCFRNRAEAVAAVAGELAAMLLAAQEQLRQTLELLGSPDPRIGL
jgi:predicted transcriptional regulator